MKNKKTTKYFSKPLMIQNLKSNLGLMILITLVMCLMAVVINYASGLMGTGTADEDVSEAQTEFYSYLYVIASYNEMMGSDLSYDDYIETSDKSMYENVFTFANSSSELGLSVDGFDEAITGLKKSDVSIDVYVREFEYVYALGNVKGCFSDEDLDVEDMLMTMLETMGISSDLITNMGSMDSTSLLTSMYYTIIGILPMLIFIVIVANSLIASQVDKGSMAYVLSTPTERRAVSITQALYLILVPLVMIAIVCCARLISSYVFFDEVEVACTIVSYVGMYLLTEAVAGICYLGSSFANLSRRSLSFGGGLTVWFFIASFLGMFGTEDMVNAGMGADVLDVFNKLTINSLVDVSSINTIGTGSIDYTFLWKFGILIAISLCCYVIGMVKFKKKDLPL